MNIHQILLICFVCTFTLSTGVLGACSSASGCGIRAYLGDLQTEYDKLSCLNIKLNKTVTLMTSLNSTAIASQIKTRTTQLKKIVDAQNSLSLEMALLAEKCAKYDGDNCDQPICFGILPSNSSICSGHGKCVATDTCLCDAGWTTSSCSVFTCNGIPSNNATVCSGRGVCVSTNNCSCMSGVTGTWCNSVTITTDSNGVRKYTDGTYARSCKEYLNPTSSSYYYSGSTGNGYYWIKPDSTPLRVLCEMIANGGGLTALTTDVEASSLNQGSQSRNYIYLKDSNTWYKSPSMTTAWNSGVKQRVGGTYFCTSNNGATLNSFSCGTAETNIGSGVGCSDGSNMNNKIFVEYRMGVVGENLARICQDSPAIFGAGCQNNLYIYIV